MGLMILMGQTDRQTDLVSGLSVPSVDGSSDVQLVCYSLDAGGRYRSIAAGGAAYRLAIEFAAGAREQQRVAQGRRPGQDHY